MTADYADIIKSSVSVKDACDNYGIPGDRGGFTNCPFHLEKSGSLKVYPGRRGFYCFGCHRGGDVIDFVGQYFGLDFQKAMSKLNDDFHLGLPINEKQTAEQERKARQEAFKRRKAQEERQKQHKALQDSYDKALTDFATLDKVADKVRSEGLLEGLEAIAGSELYNAVLDSLDEPTVFALKNIDAAAYALTETQTKLSQFEKQSKT